MGPGRDHVRGRKFHAAPGVAKKQHNVNRHLPLMLAQHRLELRQTQGGAAVGRDVDAHRIGTGRAGVADS